MEFTSDVITVEVADHVATVWLDRPEKRNAMGRAFWVDLPRAMELVSADEDVRVVIIAGRGPSFTVGLDLIEFAGFDLASGSPSPAAGAKKTFAEIKHMQWTMTSIAECAKPVIVAVHGHCLGGGIDLITAADIRLASTDAVFSVRETKIAIVADVGTLQRLPKIVAAGHVAELAYTGKDIDAARAAEIGLVNDVFEDHDTLMKATYEMAREIAANSPLVVQGVKHILRAGESRTVAEALDYVALYNTSHLRSADLAEAMAAFVEKRPPEFTGN
ncbi:MAG: crotonase/enoyl-CoA hydratase family protein [Acidimicrobiia bacterium]|nr:crotonase/enoyl-CoA hydratase family protein [Acidimicrobiia bacterium]